MAGSGRGREYKTGKTHAVGVSGRKQAEKPKLEIEVHSGNGNKFTISV